MIGGWLVALPVLTRKVDELRPGFDVPIIPALLLFTLAVAVCAAIALGVTDHWDVRWLATAGALTYPFYLLHQRIGYTVLRAARDHTALPAWLLLTLMAGLLLTVAWVVYRFAEKPLRRLLVGRS